MILLLLPSLVRFGMLTGNPVFGLRGAEVWMSTATSPGFEGYRLTPEDLTPGSSQFKPLLLKIFLAANAGVIALQRLPAICILLFVVPGLFFRYGDRGVNKVRNIMFACLLGVFVGNIGFIFDPTLFMVVFPVLLLYALAYLTHLAQEARLNNLSLGLASAGIATVLLFPLIASLVTTHRPVTVPGVEVARSLLKQSRPDEISFSDQPWIVAWYANRPSIWIPVNDTQITAMRKQFTKARWLFLTSETRSLSQEWDIVFNGLMQWDRQYQQTQQGMASPPPSLRITRQQLPLTEALEGFEALPPVEKDRPTAVLAAVPGLTLTSSLSVADPTAGTAK
jgi:hypothetical protein